MPDNETEALLSESEKKSGNSIKRDVLLALIEHASRPLASVFIGLIVLMFFFFAKDHLIDLLGKTDSVKLGSFELKIREEADSKGVSRELRELQGLNKQQIQLFLIIGKVRQEHITYGGEEVTEKNLYALQDVGLLQSYTKREDGGFDWIVSQKGDELHDIIFKNVVMEISQAD